MSAENVKKLFDTAPEFTAPACHPRPDWPFRLTQNGVEVKREKEDKETGVVTAEWVRFCSYIEVAALTRSSENNDWGRLLVVKDSDGHRHEWAMPMELFAGNGDEMRRTLLNLGMTLSTTGSARRWLSDYLQGAEPGRRVRCVTKQGWAGSAFVTPGKTFGHNEGDDDVILQSSGATKLDCRGSIDEWKENVASLAVGNSRLALAISAAFAGPLLEIAGEDSFGFHFSGKSSSGKTTALHLASSVWGSPINSWRVTDNAGEGLARSSNDGLLILDELSQVDGRAADAMSYLLGNGQGKARMRKDSTNRPIATWRLVFLSTGEIGLAEKISEAGKKARAGQSVRMIEIPADTGSGHKMFENLHGYPDGDAIAKAIKLGSATHRGHAINKFLSVLTKAREGIAEPLRKEISGWIEQNLPAGADGQVSRVAARFALVAAAGQLATAARVLPWPPGEAAAAAAICFRAWIEARGGAGAAENEAGLSQVRAFIEAYGESRFVRIDEGGAVDFEIKAISRAGYRRKDASGHWEYLVLPEVWRSEVCRGMDYKAVARDLAARGMLIPASDGTPSRSERVSPHIGQTRVYRLTPAILEG